jgi:hypothetical protein
MIDLNNSKFYQIFEKYLEGYHNLFPNIPLQDNHLESIIEKSFIETEEIQNVDHTPLSHSIGYDLSIKQNNINSKISIKSGKYNSKNNTLIFSSYRTTSYKTINEKIDFINKNHFDYQINFSKKDVWDKTKEYKFLVFSKEQFKINNLEFKEDESGWLTENEYIKINIRKSMSDQVWYTVNLNKTKPLFLKSFNTPQHNLEWLSKTLDN